MKKMTDEELKNILNLHEKWLNGEPDGVQANLHDVDLTGIYLINKNLSWASLHHVILKHSILDNANLKHVNLLNVNLEYSSLRNTNLESAVLCKVNFSDANIIGANFCNAVLENVSFENVYHDESTIFFALQCPEEGGFIGYKKAINKDEEFVIVKLQITEDAKRSSATSRKCRCSKAKVLSITSIDGKIEYDSAHACYDLNFVYKVGEIVEVTNFNEDRWRECSTGIHFFITRDEAVQYF
ncbi:MAG: pentapeptide repeat-containing protein [Ruminococcus sp.]|nr:pentapeptide repeat-containing protein [Ruminococcus sp.]